MVVYVKESGSINVNTVYYLMKDSVVIKPLEDIKSVSVNDFIIASKSDDILLEKVYEYNVIVYEEIFEKIAQNVLQESEYRHDYYYLKHALIQAKNAVTTTIVSGSSYGAFGIESSIIPNCVNLSAISQDLFYSTRLIYKAWEENKNIKNVVLCFGYYIFYVDLSSVQSPAELMRNSNIYKPLLNETHNCILIPQTNNMLYDSPIFDIQKIIDLHTKEEYNRGFFHSKRPRMNFVTREWNDTTKKWQELTEDEKSYAGKRRGMAHNKLHLRTNSFQENILIFQKFVRFCDDNGINLLVVVMPATTSYANAILPQFKSDFYEVLNQMDGTIHLLDLFEDEAFDDADFNDMDHLNDMGAMKFSLLVKNILDNNVNK